MINYNQTHGSLNIQMTKIVERHRKHLPYVLLAIKVSYKSNHKHFSYDCIIWTKQTHLEGEMLPNTKMCNMLDK